MTTSSPASHLQADTDDLTMEDDGSSSTTLLDRIRNFVQKELLFVLTLAGVAAGLVVGVIVQQSVSPYTSDTSVVLLKFPGEILIRMLNGVILPLIAASIIEGIGSIDSRSFGKIGGVAVVYYLTTTLSAAILAVLMALAIKPGNGVASIVSDSEGGVSLNENANTLDTIMDVLRSAFPDNLVEATFGKDGTEITAMTREDGSSYLERSLQFEPGMNMIGIVVMSIVTGAIMSLYPQDLAPLMKVIKAINFLTMKIVTLILWYSPFGIFSLIAAQFAGIKDFGEVVKQLAVFCGTALGGIAIHFFLVLPGLFTIVTRRNPLKYYGNMLPALATAFSTSSSAATMPVTLTCAEEKNSIDKRISRFVIPVGATINMDGAALYEALVCLFVAQAHGVPLNGGQVIVTVLTATLTAIGAAGVPNAGMFTSVMVLNAVGLPLDLLPLLYTVDWFIDRFRTCTNVMGDALGCAVVQKICSKDLANLDKKDLEEEEL